MMARRRMARHGALAALCAWALGAAGGAAAQDFLESVPAEPGGRLRVRLDVGSVEIESHAEESVRVDARASGPGADGVRFELRGGGSEVEFEGRAGSGGFWGLFGSPSVWVRVRVPETFSVEVRTSGGSVDVERLHGSVSATTSGGAIGVEGARGPVELRTSGGPIRAERIEGDVSARSSGGEIDLAEVKGAIEARTSGGGIELRDVRGPVDARTSGGPIRARFTAAPAGHLETSGGSVEVEIPAGAGADLDARTSGGRIDIEPSLAARGSIEPTRVQGTIGGGGAPLVLRTSGGNVELRAD